ncbi:MAG: GNAT family N-acetyltransferase [Bacteroidota bacterium]
MDKQQRPYHIRFAVQEDMAQIMELCAAHAAYEQSAYDAEGKEDHLADALFGKKPLLHCLVAEKEGVLMGYATYMYQYSTWDACQYVYMDCLYLHDRYRSQGIGKALMLRIKEEAGTAGCHLIQWQTPDFNEGAIRFYKRMGAYAKSKERFFWEWT